MLKTQTQIRNNTLFLGISLENTSSEAVMLPSAAKRHHLTIKIFDSSDNSNININLLLYLYLFSFNIFFQISKKLKLIINKVENISDHFMHFIIHL